MEPNVICYNAVIHACARAGDCERAHGRIDRVIAHGAKPRVNRYSAVMGTLAEAGVVEAAENGAYARSRRASGPTS